MTYPNEALAAAAKVLVEWDLSADDIANLCHDLPGEYPAYVAEAKREDDMWDDAFSAKILAAPRRLEAAE